MIGQQYLNSEEMHTLMTTTTFRCTITVWFKSINQTCLWWLCDRYKISKTCFLACKIYSMRALRGPSSCSISFPSLVLQEETQPWWFILCCIVHRLDVLIRAFSCTVYGLVQSIDWLRRPPARSPAPCQVGTVKLCSLIYSCTPDFTSTQHPVWTHPFL